MEGVKRVEELGGGRFRVGFTEYGPVADRLVEESSRNAWHLQEIRLERSSLDTVFAALSQKAGQ